MLLNRYAETGDASLLPVLDKARDKIAADIGARLALDPRPCSTPGGRPTPEHQRALIAALS